MSVLDALESGLTALKLDEARRDRSVVNMTAIWDKFDGYGLSKDAIK